MNFFMCINYRNIDFNSNEMISKIGLNKFSKDFLLIFYLLKLEKGFLLF